MIGFISESAVDAFAHRQHRLREELYLARRQQREQGPSAALTAEIERIEATMQGIEREARKLGVRVPSRYNVL